ncbi:MAG: T9SS type A sorting domain-containing protein [Bacteroidota bacterium]
MKQVYSLLFMFIGTLSFAQTIYSENFGEPTGTTTLANYTIGTAPATFQNSAPITYTGTGDVRLNSVSSGYSGASGAGNVFLNSTAGRFLTISGLNTSSYLQADIRLSFGYLRSVLGTQMVVEASTDGSTWTPITFSQPANTGWNLITVDNNQIPSSSTLSLRFTQPAGAQMRIDDVKLANVSASCTLVLGAPGAVCNASTLALDTYTVTIPFTGAGNATYVVTPTSGIVGGDNPTSVVAGNIIITGITEGTPYSVNVTGGTCNFTTNGNSPDCKPTNTLPLNEPFNYTAGNSLGLEQTWAYVSSGDAITVDASNLTYGTLVGTGNSVVFSGTGNDAITPFTPTTTGTVFAGFMFTVTDLTGVTDGNDSSFAVLTNEARTFKVRLNIKRVASQYQIGLAGDAITNYDVTLRNIGDVVYVILGYDFGNNAVVNAWINPDLLTYNSSTTPTLTATTAAIGDLGGFILRQDSATNTPLIKVDELKISTVAIDYNLSSSSFSQIDGLKMYPNPTKNNLFIETALNSDINVSIVNMLGKEVVNANVVNNTVNVSNLTSGIYIVKITEEGKTSTKKLIIN